MMKKLLAALLAAALLMSCCASALGENIKHERVYIVAGPDGDIRSLTDSIRLENKDGLKEIVDVSLLTGIENMSGDEPFTRDGDALIWQAKGNDIVYQGTSDQTPAILPAVTLILDGEAITAAELKNKTGEAVLTVSYRAADTLPALAVTLLPLDDFGMKDIRAENAMILSEAGQRVLVGYAAPGVASDLKLPDHFTVSFHADHANLSWMMTLISADPVRLACKEIDERLPLNLRDTLNLAESLLTALKNGEDLPMQKGLQNLKTNIVLGQVNDFNHSVVKLDDSAQALKDSATALANSAKTLKDSAQKAQSSAQSLQASLNGLQKDGDALNTQAAALLAAAFQDAKVQLAAMNVTVPELTAENYAQALDAAAAGEGQEGDVSAKIAALKAQLTQTVQFVNSLKTYTEAAGKAAQGADALNTSLTGLKENADALQSGASALQKDAEKLQKNGTAKVKSTVLTTEKQLAALALPYVQRDALHILELYEQTRDQAQNGGYDLRPEGMQAVTVYVIRTDLK